MPTPDEWRERLNLEKDEIIPFGRLCKLDFMKIMERLKDKPDGKYIDITAITPTPLGEGKATTTMGLTGDINDLMNAHNLAMVALTARMQMDFCAQSLRNIIIGIGERIDGYTMQFRFDIAVSSELMAILSIARDLADLRDRMDKITVAFDKRGNPVTTGDLEVGGAMTAFMRNTINPTLMCIVEYQPVLIHAGPFANIAVGQSSIIADQLALKMFDYNVTESGFGADIGFEKFWNVKCRLSGLKPQVAVLTTTIRALNMHGGGPKVVAGIPLPDAYAKENLGLLEKSIPNMLHHINTIRTSGVNPVVCINRFHTDTEAEVAMVKKAAEAAGVPCAASTHWADGGDGALELADVVIEACKQESLLQNSRMR